MSNVLVGHIDRTKTLIAGYAATMDPPRALETQRFETADSKSLTEIINSFSSHPTTRRIATLDCRRWFQSAA